uniref:Uncharacterized protein n=1 Tax=Chromera velia CCMP2878 TaxID=1169474 RepID=A0A0G4F0P8_9ALVE|eukprot:Cvel_14508.t1-p1 / transcript=Cvel_14508.t1 / gene=Cvel_14508 / organism=Chromera_velia_CCMP2878 / gene_product=hypothetical protein / transcript_product=hypothetical protein / location=Cvel_scaffold1035:27871-29913(-) / protein_length=553 / sequence_SO=supercontig / SO=protein_coding / is_pseudo=false
MATLSLAELGIFFIIVAVVQALAAMWLYHRSANFIGTRNVTRLKWENGLDKNLVGAKQLPLSRFIGVIISAISFVEYSLKAAQAFDLYRDQPIGFNTIDYAYWGYIVGCPLIMYDWAETIRMEGVTFYAGAVFGALVMANATEIIQGSAHWLLFSFGLTIVLVIICTTGKQAMSIIKVCKQHACSKKAGNMLIIASCTMLIGWAIFPTAWILRDDIDPSHGIVDLSVIDLMHGIGDIISKPLFAIFLVMYREYVEDLHFKDIIKELKWTDEDVKNIADMKKDDVPNEVLIRTVPALLDHLLANQSHLTRTLQKAVAYERLKSRANTLQQTKGAEFAAAIVADEHARLEEQFKSPGVKGGSPPRFFAEADDRTGRGKQMRVEENAPAHGMPPQFYPPPGPYAYPPPQAYAYPYPPPSGIESPGGGVDQQRLTALLGALQTLTAKVQNAKVRGVLKKRGQSPVREQGTPSDRMRPERIVSAASDANTQNRGSILHLHGIDPVTMGYVMSGGGGGAGAGVGGLEGESDGEVDDNALQDVEHTLMALDGDSACLFFS